MYVYNGGKVPINFSYRLLSGSLLVLALLQSELSSAAPKQETPEQQAYKKAQGVIRQLTEEKRALETERTELRQKLTQLEMTAGQLQSLQAQLKSQQAHADSLKQSNDALETRLNSENHKQQDLQNQLKNLGDQARLIAGDNQLLVAAINERQHWMAQCAEHNRELVAASEQLVNQFQHQGWLDRLAGMEPFTGIANVSVQNSMEAFQFRVEDLKVTPYKNDSSTMVR